MQHLIEQVTTTSVELHEQLEASTVDDIVGRGRRRCCRRLVAGFGDGLRCPLGECSADELGANGLGDVVVHACGDARVAVTGHCCRGHRYDRRVAVVAFELANRPCRLVAVEHGHLAVHEDHVIALLR